MMITMTSVRDETFSLRSFYGERIGLQINSKVKELERISVDTKEADNINVKLKSTYVNE